MLSLCRAMPQGEGMCWSLMVVKMSPVSEKTEILEPSPSATYIDPVWSSIATQTGLSSSPGACPLFPKATTLFIRSYRGTVGSSSSIISPTPAISLSRRLVLLRNFTRVSGRGALTSSSFCSSSARIFNWVSRSRFMRIFCSVSAFILSSSRSILARSAGRAMISRYSVTSSIRLSLTQETNWSHVSWIRASIGSTLDAISCLLVCYNKRDC